VLGCDLGWLGCVVGRNRYVISDSKPADHDANGSKIAKHSVE
jgi:hypothetical protein